MKEMKEITYLSEGLDAELHTVEQGSPQLAMLVALRAEFDRVLQPVADALARGLAQLMAAINESGFGAVDLDRRARRARISAAWSDPAARWTMWSRKSDRDSRRWIRRDR
jgi:hypothetical protein